MSILGNPYFIVPLGMVNHVIFKHGNKMLFTSTTTTLYAKALPQSMLSVLWPVPPAFFIQLPRLDPRHWGGDTTLGTVACCRMCCCTPSRMDTTGSLRIACDLLHSVSVYRVEISIVERLLPSQLPTCPFNPLACLASWIAVTIALLQF